MTAAAEQAGRGAGEIDVRAARDGDELLLVSLRWLPEVLEAEPNDARESAQALELPRIVNWRIEAPGDRDLFRIEGPAGLEIVAEVQARRLGSPLDSFLRVTDEQGTELAANDDHEDPGAGLSTHHADSQLRFRMPEKGDAWLQLYADRLGMEVVSVRSDEPAVQGAALIAARAAGWFPSVAEAQRAWVTVRASFVPS